jgi:thiol-disulfide isomerase/thioredoxin
MTSRPRVLALAALLCGGLLAGCSNDISSSGGDQGFVAGKGIITSVKTAADRKAPGAVAGTTLDGDRVSLADYRGKVVVVNVWGSWCGPCRAEAGMLADASRELGPRGVEFLGIDSRDPSAGNARAFVRRFKIPYPSIYDQQGSTLLAFRGTLPATTVPSTVVIDAQGRVSGSVIGPITRTTLDDLVEDAS